MLKLKGERQIVSLDDLLYPELLKEIPDPPKQLYVIGSLEGFNQGLAISGPRKATEYGRRLAALIAQSASLNETSIVTGGARGIDEAAMRVVVSLYEDATKEEAAAARRKAEQELFDPMLENNGRLPTRKTCEEEGIKAHQGSEYSIVEEVLS